MLILVGVLALTGIMYMSTPQELAPDEDQGVLFALVKTPQYANLDYHRDRRPRKLNKVLDTIPEKDHVFAINGSAGVHQGFARPDLEALGRAQAQPEGDPRRDSQPKLADDHRAPRCSPSRRRALPGSTGGPPLQFVIRTTGDYKQLADVMAEDAEAAARRAASSSSPTPI